MRIPADPSIAPPTLDYYLDAQNAFTGDVATDLAVMLLDYVRESRQLNQEQTRVEEAHLRFEQAAQIEDMREEADKIRDAGKIRGASLIASGGLTISSAATSEAGAAGLKGSADAVKGSSELGTAYVDRHAALARTRATEHEHRAGESERRLDTLDEAHSHSEKLEQSAFEHLQSVQETRAAIDRASTSWRG